MYQNLKALRTSLDMTQEEFGSSVGIAKTTYSNYEQGVREPKSDFWIAVADKYNVTIDYLIGRCDDPHGLYQGSEAEDGKQANNTFEECEIIKKYRFLDQKGQETVRTILDSEVDRVQALRERDARIAELESTPNTEMYRYPYLHRIACAGTAFAFDEIPTDTKEAPFIPGADFIIGVLGDSMNPTYYDGDLLYVRKTDRLNFGDIGIFMIGNEWYVKEYGRNGLISHNPKYHDILGNEDIRIVGEVVGKVE